MIALAALKDPRAFFARARALPAPTTGLRPPPTALSAGLIQHGIFGLKLIAGALGGATIALAITNYGKGRPVATALEPDGYETVVYRQDARKSYARLGEDAAYRDGQSIPSNFPRAVQTIKFVNADPGAAKGAVVAAAGESFKLASSTVFEPQASIKVGGFVAFPAKEAAAPAVMGAARHALPRKRGAAVMTEVDDYLWQVYQRQPIKKDSSGDFTWKDPAAANHVGMSMQEYVIGGMDPEFKEQLYHAGRAMDAAGIQWSILSAFRDDYRQRLAKGFKARVGNSLHGGSRRTGGYGHGRAVDVTNADGDADIVWQWIDAHGSKYGLHRPIPGPDPAHLQSKGDGRKVAVALRETRARHGGKAKVVAKASN